MIERIMEEIFHMITVVVHAGLIGFSLTAGFFLFLMLLVALGD